MNQLESVVSRLMLALYGAMHAPSLKREEGQTLVEYALILAFIAILVIGALTFLKSQITTVFSNIGNSI